MSSNKRLFKASLSVLSVFALLLISLSVLNFVPHALAEETSYAYDFEGSVDVPGWTKFGGALTMEIDTTVAHSGNNSLKAYGQENTWTSATKDILPAVKENGAGEYTYTAWLLTDADVGNINFRLRINGVSTEEEIPSFANEGLSNVALRPLMKDAAANTWTEFSFSFVVTESDLNKGSSWEPCYCDITPGVTYWIDDVTLVKVSGSEGEDGDNDLGGYTFSFESGKATNELGITAFGGPLTMENDSTVAHNGSHSIKAYGHENTWTSPTKDILSYVQNNGAATYSLDAWIYCTADAPHCSFRLRFLGIDKEADNPSFANELFVTGGNQNVCYYVNGAVEAETWTKFHLTFTVSEEDLNKGTSWVPCFCDIPVGATFWIDDLSLRLHGAEYQQDENGNYIPAGDSSFEDVTSPYDTNWIIFGGSQKMEIDSTVAHSGSCSLKAFDHKNEWTSPSYSLFNMFKDLGYGKYTISAWVRADKESAGVTLRMRCLDVLSEEDNPSFVNEPYVNGGNANTAISLGAKDIQADEWVEFTDSFIIKDEDIQNDHTWELNFTGFQPGTTFWIDDVTVKKFVNPDLYFTYETSTDMVEKINVLNGRKVKINAITAESIEDDELIWEVIAGEATIETVEELEEILHSQSVYVKPVRGSVVIIRATLKSNPELVAEVQMKVKANLAPLRTLIIKAEKLLEDSISDDAKQKLTAEIGKAQDLLDADEITQDQVDEALDVLQAAIDAVTAE